jgi:hypothetical protein
MTSTGVQAGLSGGLRRRPLLASWIVGPSDEGADRFQPGSANIAAEPVEAGARATKTAR